MNVISLSALRIRRLYHRDIFLALISIIVRIDHKYTVRTEELSMINFNDDIGNRTRDLPDGSAVPQTPSLPRVPSSLVQTKVYLVTFYLHTLSHPCYLKVSYKPYNKNG